LVKNNSDKTPSKKIDPETPLPDDITSQNREDSFYGITDRDQGIGETIEDIDTNMASGKDPRGGDIDANLYQSKVVGEEAVGGSTPTPGQNVSQELQNAAGISSEKTEPVQTSDKLERRDEKRWELEPKSSEDYELRRKKEEESET